jgi:hypothetical protein
MAGLPRIAAAEVHRVRRFDALVLGGALPGLVAAIRLAQRGARVLVVEEEAALRAHPGWREPFLLWDAEPAGVLGACLRALAVPLIDQRRLLVDDLALQVVTPRARLDWGRAPLASTELTSWGLSKPDEAFALLRALADAGTRARDALLASPAAPRARRGAGDVSQAPAETGPLRWPPALEHAQPALRALLHGIAQALSEQATPPSEAAALRLLGATLGGGAILSGEGGLRDLLWRRYAALFGERRSIPGPLRLVSAAQLAAVEAPGVQEILAGRALILNAPRDALARVHEGQAPSLLKAPPATHRRIELPLRAPAELLPEAMAPRLLLLGDGAPVRVARHAGRRGEQAELLVSTLAPRDADADAILSRLERTIDELAPFCADRLERRPLPAARWDRDDGLLAAADSSGATRVSRSPLVVALERGASAAWGFEGDLLLGWRAGDELCAELRLG